jgi:hypothetical protein
MRPGKGFSKTFDRKRSINLSLFYPTQFPIGNQVGHRTILFLSPIHRQLHIQSRRPDSPSRVIPSWTKGATLCLDTLEDPSGCLSLGQSHVVDVGASVGSRCTPDKSTPSHVLAADATPTVVSR